MLLRDIVWGSAKLGRACKEPATPGTLLTTLVNEILLFYWIANHSATRTAHYHKSGSWQDTLNKRALSGTLCCCFLRCCHPDRIDTCRVSSSRRPV